MDCVVPAGVCVGDRDIAEVEGGVFVWELGDRRSREIEEEHWEDSAAAKEVSNAATDIHDLPTIMIGAIREQSIS